MKQQESENQNHRGKIIKTKDGYRVKTMTIAVMEEFDIKPHEITLSNHWDWCRHDCCICGGSFRTYTPNAQVNFLKEDSPCSNCTRFPICDNCLETNCPELYARLIKQRAKFDNQRTQAEKTMGGS